MLLLTCYGEEVADHAPRPLGSAGLHCGPLSVTGIPVPGTPGIAASIGGLSADDSSPTHPPNRSSVLGVGISSMGRLAECPGDRSAAYRHCLAAPALSRLLARSEPARHAWPATDCPRTPRSHPHDVAGQSGLGRPTDR